MVTMWMYYCYQKLIHHSVLALTLHVFYFSDGEVLTSAVDILNGLCTDGERPGSHQFIYLVVETCFCQMLTLLSPVHFQRSIDNWTKTPWKQINVEQMDAELRRFAKASLITAGQSHLSFWAPPPSIFPCLVISGARGCVSLFTPSRMRQNNIFYTLTMLCGSSSLPF